MAGAQERQVRYKSGSQGHIIGTSNHGTGDGDAGRDRKRAGALVIEDKESIFFLKKTELVI